MAVDADIKLSRGLVDIAFNPLADANVHFATVFIAHISRESQFFRIESINKLSSRYFPLDLHGRKLVSIFFVPSLSSLLSCKIRDRIEVRVNE